MRCNLRSQQSYTRAGASEGHATAHSMGNGSSVARRDLAVRTLILSQQSSTGDGDRSSPHRRRSITLRNAVAAARFCPALSPAECLRWLDEPILVDPPANVASMTFELPLTTASQRWGLRVMTTLVLPNGKRIAVRPHPTGASAEVLSVRVPVAALEALGEQTLGIFVEDEGSDAPSSLEATCPAIPAHLVVTQGCGASTATCVVCNELLIGDGQPNILRQLCASPCR